MRIVIDLQGAQASSAQRGIGRYSMALTLALLQTQQHEFHVALNGSLQDSALQLRDRLATWLPPDRIHTWFSPHPPGEPVVAGTQAERVYRAAQDLRASCLRSLQPDAVLVTSHFESPAGGGVTGRWQVEPPPSVMVLYDLIPLLRPETYLTDPTIRTWYERQIDDAKRSAAMLAISSSSRREGIDHLGISPARCVDMSSDTDPHFKTLEGHELDAAVARVRGLGLGGPFLLYTGGIDPRKNVERLIEAFARLPEPVRKRHRLVVVCGIHQAQRRELERRCRASGLRDEEVVLTGYVDEQTLVSLYNLCTGFIYPSVHEGFGLPVLEAMRCGAAAIASSTTSLPEVLGREDALFDPESTHDMARQMERLLTDEVWRHELKSHAATQATQFSWTATASRALEAMERCIPGAAGTNAPRAKPDALPARGDSRPRLAMVSPWPPQRSGIANHAADLLPGLASSFELTLVRLSAEVNPADPRLCAHGRVVDVPWFEQHAHEFDHIVYQLGNSAFHDRQFDLIERFPGVVVLHDFFLSGVMAHREWGGQAGACWTQALLEAHGYAAAARRLRNEDHSAVVYDYPCSFAPLRDALAVIVHSEHAMALGKRWYPGLNRDRWHQVPLLRIPSNGVEKREARRALGLADDEFIVCSFGMVGPTKLTLELIDGWQHSRLASDRRCRLILVGNTHPGHYGQEVLNRIQAMGHGRVMLTGWVDDDAFQRHLAAADVAIQLRRNSRGETSAAALDCMGQGLATIVNAHGTMTELPQNTVHQIGESFMPNELAAALEALWSNPTRRNQLGSQARAHVQAAHGLKACVRSYEKVLAQAVSTDTADSLRRNLLSVATPSRISDQASRFAWIRAIVRSLPESQPRQRLFVDVTELVQRDARTGIQRVVRNILGEWLQENPDGPLVCPVYSTPSIVGYRHARSFTLNWLGATATVEDEPIDVAPGDIFLGLDFQTRVREQQPFFDRCRLIGVKVCFVIYDLLPIRLPHCFSPGADESHQGWLSMVARNDGAFCISKAVADDLHAWLVDQRSKPGAYVNPHFKIDWFHLGSDLAGKTRSSGAIEAVDPVVSSIDPQCSLLMVGTLEPRKGHQQALEAFEMLWQRGSPAQLVIAGKAGWMTDSLQTRLRHHAEHGRRLFWFEQPSDELLESIYERASGLLAASEGEGFGLPLIEAAEKGKPILARDIPVFREVAAEHAAYFQSGSTASMADQIATWMTSFSMRSHPESTGMPRMTWKQSAAKLRSLVLSFPAPEPRGGLKERGESA